MGQCRGETATSCASSGRGAAEPGSVAANAVAIVVDVVVVGTIASAAVVVDVDVTVVVGGSVVDVTVVGTIASAAVVTVAPSGSVAAIGGRIIGAQRHGGRGPERRHR